EGNLYAESYVDQDNGPQGGPDFIVKLSKQILNAPAGDLSQVTLTRYQVPSVNTVLHRIILGGDGNLYFTELNTDTVGRLLVSGATPTRHVTSDPTKADTDGDGLSDGQERALGTDPTAADTDADGLTDKAEVTPRTVTIVRADGSTVSRLVISDP